MAAAPKLDASRAKRPKTGGRIKGTPNKTTRVIKEAVIEAAAACHPDGMVGYLIQQAKDQPVAFLGLMGRVLPIQHTGEGGGPVKAEFTIISGVPRAND